MARIIMMVFFVLASMTPALAANQKIVLRAQADIYGYFAQQAMVFDGKTVLLSMNSNFLCPPSDTFRLGIFHSTYDKKQVAFEKARVLSLQVKKNAPKNSSRPVEHSSPHDLKLFVGTSEITGHEKLAHNMEQLLLSYCQDQDWTTEKGVRVSVEKKNNEHFLVINELAGAQKGKVKTVSFKEADCKIRNNRWNCLIPPYGMAYLQVK